MGIDAVVFDIGNVLLEWDPERFFDAKVGRARRKALFSETAILQMNDRLDQGAPFRKTVYDFADQNPEYRDEIRMWHDHWLDMAHPRIHRSVALMRGLRDAGVAVFALSNFGVGTFAVACAEYEFLTEFDRRYISGHLGVCKPDPEIYALVETDSGIAPERLFFTDDRPENIDAAAARGWQTHLFAGPDGLAAALRGLGLPVA